MGEPLHEGWHYRIKNAESGTILDLSGADGRSIIGYTQKDGPNQHWLLERGDNGLWVLRNGTGLYLSLPWGVDPNNGVPLTALDNRQEFEIIDSEQVEGAYKILCPGSHFVVDLSDHGNAQDGTPVTLWGKWEGKNQSWYFEPVPGD